MAGPSKVCFILVAGLDQNLLERTPGLKTLRSFSATVPMRPVTPAVTSTMQATLTTGKGPGEHGIIANGLYTHNRAELQGLLDLSSFGEFRKQTSFWEQSNGLLESPRFWEGTGKKVAMLFWQNSMGGAAEVVVTPKPTHTADGKTMTACWSAPAELYGELVGKLGPFPLHQYWGPMASLPSSAWIIQAAVEVWKKGEVDLELVYIPQMDYNLQRRGPEDASVVKDLQELDAALEPLVAAVRGSGGQVIIAGDYGMTAVRRAVMPNVALREAGLLATRVDEAGKLLVDYDKSQAFAMVDHQIAHVYGDATMHPEIVKALGKLEGVGRILAEPGELEEIGLTSGRKGGRHGEVVLLAESDAWFAHDWWLNDGEKPAWQFGVDIHRKPGYDPRELFFDRERKCIAQDAGLVKGSHGLVGVEEKGWPVVMCDAGIAPQGERMEATEVAGWLKGLLAG